MKSIIVPKVPLALVLVKKVYIWEQKKYCRVYSRNLGQCSILARVFFWIGLFLNKGHLKFYPCPFLSVLYQNKVLYNFCKWGQHLIVSHNIGLEYTLYYLVKFSRKMFVVFGSNYFLEKYYFIVRFLLTLKQAFIQALLSTVVFP